MADSWSVPINTAGIDALDDTIAKGQNYSWIGNLLNDYTKGKDLRYQQDQRDAFKGGLPKDANGNVDWSQVSDTLAKVGGIPQVQNLVGLQKFDLAKQLMGDPAQPTPPSATQFPPSTSRTVPSQPQAPNAQPASAADAPSGTPAPPGQNLTGDGKTITGVDYGPVQTNGGGGLTPRMIASRTGGDASAIASGLGVSPDEVIDPNDPQMRAKLVQTVRYTQANPQGQPTQAQPPQMVAQNAPQTNGAPLAQPQATQPPPTVAGPQGNINEMTAARYELIAQDAFRKAQAAAIVDPAMSQAFKAKAESAMKQAEIIRSALAKNAETTPEMKNASSSGQPSPLDYARTVEQNKAAAKNTEITPEMKNAASSGLPTPRDYANATESDKQDSDAFQKRYTTLQAVGEQAYNGIEKAKLMKQLTLQPSFYSGPLHEGVQTFNQFRSIFGANPSSALPTEAFNKVANDMLTEQVKAMGQSGVGRVLQSEVNIMKQAIASLGITPQSNRALAEILTRVYQQNQDIAEMSRNIPRTPGQMNRQLDTAVSGYLKSHPLFTPQEQQHPSTLGSPDAPPQSAQWSPEQKRQWAASIGLKPGDPIRFGGQVVQVP